MMHGEGHGGHGRRAKRRSPARFVVGTTVALAVLAGAGYWGYSALSDDKKSVDPEITAATAHLNRFLDAWEAGDAARAGALTDSPANAESLIASVTRNLKPSKTLITAGKAEKTPEDAVEVPFTVRMTVPGAGPYSWRSTATLVGDEEVWEVRFTTPLVHPRMAPGQTLALKSRERAAVLDRNGDELESASLVGSVDPKTGKGTSGLQARYDRQLGGGDATKSVVVVDRESGQVVRKLTTPGGAQARPVRTTVDPVVQRAAAAALDGVEKNAAIVAIEPGTGEILAAANVPGGMNRALEGRYPPGSTFKVVTAAALLQAGARPSDPGDCPKYAYVNGQRFENQAEFELAAGATFREAFAKSCNTFFVGSRDRLTDTTLRDTAAAFGIGGVWDVGISTYDGDVPAATSENDKAATTIGQGRVQASPLVMASVAATVKEGTFRQPVLVPAAVKRRHRATATLAPGVVADLRAMMRATVTDGAGWALKDLPGEPHAKTGTAEFGSETPPRTHAWMIGYQGDRDLAWAVLLEDGGSGGADAGPVAARFLEALDR